MLDLRSLAPAGAVALGALLPWLRGLSEPVNSFELPVSFLFSTQADDGLKLGFLLLAAGAALAVHGQAQLRRIAAFAVIAVGALYVVQLQRLLSQADFGGSIISVVGPGVLVTVAGAVTSLVWKPPQPVT